MTTQAADDDVALKLRVAEEIRGLMGRRNMSRVKLAQELGQSRTYVGRRLTGETAFDLDDLEAIGRVFGVPVAALMGIVPLHPAPVPPGGPAASGGDSSTTRRNSTGELNAEVIRPLFGEGSRPAVVPACTTAVRDRISA